MSTDADGNPSIEFADIQVGQLIHAVFQYFDDALGPGLGSVLEHRTKVRAKDTTKWTTWGDLDCPIETGWSPVGGGQVTYYLMGSAAATEPTLGSCMQGVSGAVYQRLGTDPAVSTWGKAGDGTTHTWAWLQANEAPLVAMTQVVGTS